MTPDVALALVASVSVLAFVTRDVVLRLYSARSAERDDQRHEEAKKFLDLVEQRVEKLDKRVTLLESGHRRRP